MSMHWVVVADAAGAAVYEGDVMLEGLSLVESMGTRSPGRCRARGVRPGWPTTTRTSWRRNGSLGAWLGS